MTTRDRASRLLARIQQRCPELTAADLLLAARVLTDRQVNERPRSLVGEAESRRHHPVERDQRRVVDPRASDPAAGRATGFGLHSGS